MTNGNFSSGISIGWNSHISDERVLCANLELIKTKSKGVKKYILRCFCLDHSKWEVVLQNCWISLMTDDFENLRKSEWVSYQTPHQQNESWSWKSSELHKDETSQYSRATGGSRFIFLSKLKLKIPIFKSFKSDCTLKFAYSLESSNIFNIFVKYFIQCYCINYVLI